MRPAYLQKLTLLCTGITAAPLDTTSPSTSALTPRDTPSCTGPGILLNNRSATTQDYVFYNNYWNGDTTAEANYDHPDQTVTLASGSTQFVGLDMSFKGRVQRGVLLPATWAELQIAALAPTIPPPANDSYAHGDISLEQGYDGPATIAATDGGNAWTDPPFSNMEARFTSEFDAFVGAPEEAFKNKSDGQKALANTVPSVDLSEGNAAAAAHLTATIPTASAYIIGGTGVPDIKSTNNCLNVMFY